MVYVSITSIDELKDIQTSMDRNAQHILLIKFSATWCKPCQSIQHVCKEWFDKLPEHVIVVEIDIDACLDLYMFMKRHRIIKGVPAIVAWYPNESREANIWYIPEDSVSGSSIHDINLFFERCSQKAKSLC
jgi:thiol-disulfide isomerase/thioredoxin